LAGGQASGSIGTVLMRLQRRRRSGWLCLLACALHLLAALCHACPGLHRPVVANGPTSSTTYDALGQVLTVTDPQGNVTTKFYDAAGRNWKVVAPAPEGSPQSPSAVAVRRRSPPLMRVVSR